MGYRIKPHAKTTPRHDLAAVPCIGSSTASFYAGYFLHNGVWHKGQHPIP